MNRHLVSALLATLSPLAMADVCVPQDRPAVNVSVGYAALKDSEVSEVFRAGWVASIGGALTRSLEVVGEVGGNYKTLPTGEMFDVKLKMHGLLGGIRWVVNGNGKVSPFVQALAGATWISFAIGPCTSIPGASCADISVADTARTYFTLQPGGGIDITIARPVRLRLQGDYRAVFPHDLGHDDMLHQFRFAAGAVFGFGNK